MVCLASASRINRDGSRELLCDCKQRKGACIQTLDVVNVSRVSYYEIWVGDWEVKFGLEWLFLGDIEASGTRC